MIYPKIPLAQSIIEICAAKGVYTIVISPGSRNAPLTIGFTNNPKFNCYSIADERCAAFFALGIAQQTKKPVAVVCTSGSALLNYYPAFAEAFYSEIPLIVLSADRPKDKIDIGDGQTIRQENVFLNHSLFNANLNEEVSKENDFLINEAINRSITKKGPVHINIPFEEPLYQTTEELLVNVTINNVIDKKQIIETKDLKGFSDIWNKSNKILVLVGDLASNEIEQKWIDKLAEFSSVVVLTESNSNLHHPSFINTIDSLITPLTEVEFQKLQPEILITFGGMLVSKRIKTFIRKHQPQQHWHIDALRAYDTFGVLSHHFEVSPNQFFSQFFPLSENLESDYKSHFEEINKIRKSKRAIYLDKIPFSDLKAFNSIVKSLPKNTQLQVGNSSPIRYVQLLDVDPSIEIFCNRGTSGIDGSTSTAIGAAVANKKQTTFITGDISFFYDSNALWNNYLPKNLKIIVINNGGGGIFRILPGHEETSTFNTFFETSHCLTAEHLAKMYRLKYLMASDEISLEKNLSKLFSSNEAPTILEVFTPTKENDKILLQFFNELV